MLCHVIVRAIATGVEKVSTAGAAGAASGSVSHSCFGSHCGAFGNGHGFISQAKWRRQPLPLPRALDCSRVYQPV